MSGMMPGRGVEGLDKLAIGAAEKKKQQQEAAPPPPSPGAAPESPIPPTPPAGAGAARPAADSPTPATAPAGAARAASLTTVPPKADPSGATMRALVWRGKKHVALVRDHPKPCVTDPADAVVRVGKAAICGSDLHLYGSSMPGMKSGDVLGHEAMGVVESVGPGVKSVRPGDRVAVSFDLACGACFFCERGLFTACDVTNPSAAQGAAYGGRTSGALGYSHLTGGHWGVDAEYARVPFADTNLLPLAPIEKEEGAAAGGAITDAQAALLGDVLPTAWTACELGEVGPRDYVVVFGAGPIGLVTAQCAAHRGARRIVLVDPVEGRLAFARRPGVVLRSKDGAPSSSPPPCRLDCVHVSGSGGAGMEAALREVARLSEGEPAGAPDVAVEAVGMHYARALHHRLQLAAGLETDSAEALNACLRAVRKGGRVSVVGVFAGSANGVLLGAFMEKGLTLRGSQAPVQRYWRELAAKVARGELDPSAVVTHALPLERAADGFRLFDEKRDGCVKVLLDVAGGGGGGEGEEAAAADTVEGVPVVALL